MKKDDVDSLVSEAYRLYNKNDLESAKKKYLEASRHRAFSKEDARTQDDTWFNLATLCSKLSKEKKGPAKQKCLSQAITAYNRYFEHGTDEKGSIYLSFCKVLMRRSWYYNKKKDMPAALQDFMLAEKQITLASPLAKEKALSSCKVELNDLERGIAGCFGDQALKNKDYAQAIIFYEGACSLVESLADLSEGNRRILGDIYFNLGECYRELNNRPKALLSYTLAFNLYDQLLAKSSDSELAADHKETKRILEQFDSYFTKQVSQESSSSNLKRNRESDIESADTSKKKKTKFELQSTSKSLTDITTPELQQMTCEQIEAIKAKLIERLAELQASFQPSGRKFGSK